MGRNLNTSLYRLLLRYARSVSDDTPVIHSFDKEAWLGKRGAPQFFAQDAASRLDRSSLTKEVRRRFREPSGTVEQALDAIKQLEEQRYLRERQRCHTTHAAGLRVRVCSLAEYVGDDRTFDPFFDTDEEGPVKQYWSYRITITNLSETKTVRVVSRHWKIFADDELVVEVPAGSPGIIGMRPELPPGGSFMYYSGTDMKSGRKGFMLGSLGVVQVGGNGNETEVVVPRMDFIQSHRV